jgi:CheY-like chemotaxis protein
MKMVNEDLERRIIERVEKEKRGALKVLFLEDMPEYAMGILRELMNYPYVEVYHSNCGTHAVALDELVGGLDVLITDEGIAGKSGYEVTLELRERGRELPIVYRSLCPSLEDTDYRASPIVDMGEELKKEQKYDALTVEVALELALGMSPKSAYELIVSRVDDSDSEIKELYQKTLQYKIYHEKNGGE